jgi:hypothetical protein
VRGAQRLQRFGRLRCWGIALVLFPHRSLPALWQRMLLRAVPCGVFDACHAAGARVQLRVVLNAWLGGSELNRSHLCNRCGITAVCFAGARMVSQSWNHSLVVGCCFLDVTLVLSWSPLFKISCITPLGETGIAFFMSALCPHCTSMPVAS